MSSSLFLDGLEMKLNFIVTQYSADWGCNFRVHVEMFRDILGDVF
jgi:hypothetical protein